MAACGRLLNVVGVFLVEDHEVVRRGIARLLAEDSDLKVVGEAGTVQEARARIPLVKPDVAVLDVRLPDGSGVELCRDLRAAMPALRCLMLTSYADDEALFASIMAGASGYLLKRVRVDELLDAVHRVAKGESLIDPSLTARVLERIRHPAESAEDPLGELSPQERRIFDLIVEGMTNREIAETIFLAEKTVKNYVSNILAKLGMHHRSEIAALGARLEERRRVHGYRGPLSES
jgi:two-component system response regulator DevR